MPLSFRRASAIGILFASLGAPAQAQYFANRTLTPVPLDDSTGRGLLSSIDYFADVQRSAHTAGDDRAWTVRLAALADLWRFTPRTLVYLSAGDETAANAVKDGGFNPRGISWELGAGVMHRHGNTTTRLGFVHYCKHEVDNSDPPGEEQTPPPGYVPQKRTLSMNALRAEVMLPRVDRGRLRLRAVSAAEWYTAQWDGRRPATTIENSWKRVQAGLSGAVRAEVAVGGGGGGGGGGDRRSAVFLRASGNALYFSGTTLYPVTKTMQHSERLELGWRVAGGGAGIELYAVGERLFDDVMVVTPRATRMLGIGIRVAERNYF